MVVRRLTTVLCSPGLVAAPVPMYLKLCCCSSLSNIYFMQLSFRLSHLVFSHNYVPSLQLACSVTNLTKSCLLPTYPPFFSFIVLFKHFPFSPLSSFSFPPIYLPTSLLYAFSPFSLSIFLFFILPDLSIPVSPFVLLSSPPTVLPLTTCLFHPLTLFSLHAVLLHP